VEKIHMNVQQKDKGFTIIEVVLVLAIAGLIFLMVFIALPALQRSQRDAQRKTDLTRAITALTTYASNNRNKVPSATKESLDSFVNSYLKAGGDSFIDPTGNDYVFDTTKTTADVVSGSFDQTNPKIYYTVGSKCADEGAVTAAGSRTVSMRMILEGGGVACENN
jgi:prepilin-type N-terminal cleavage/methylation domain-containing protein